MLHRPAPASQPSPVNGEGEDVLSRPWYYQAWFLYPSFLFWPLWSVLIIRSPWQSSAVVGSFAWAVLFIGSGLAMVRLAQGGTVAYSTLALVAPGLLLTIITQVHWAGYRRAWLAPMESGTSAPSALAGSPAGKSRRVRAGRRRSRTAVRALSRHRR